MSMPNIELNDETVSDNVEGADHIDSSAGATSIEEQTPATPATPSIDYTALYRESIAERRRLEAEAESLRQQLNKPVAQEEPDITDEFFERHGTAKGVREVVKTTVAQLLREQLGEIGELSQDFKRGKQIAAAEQKFFEEYPNLGAVKEPLMAEVRKYLADEPSVNINNYRKTALAVVGALAAQQFNPTAAAQPAQPTSTPSVPSAPAPRATGTVIRKPVRKTTELERFAMKKHGYDPNKPEDVEKFFALVDNDEGVVVE